MTLPPSEAKIETRKNISAHRSRLRRHRHGRVDPHRLVGGESSSGQRTTKSGTEVDPVSELPLVRRRAGSNTIKLFSAHNQMTSHGALE